MWLLIDADRDPATGWEGYDFIVNRPVESDGTTWLEKNTGGWNWKASSESVVPGPGPRTSPGDPALGPGPAGERDAPAIDFKWADNLQTPGDIMDFYLSGDVAPEGRFMYRYTAE